MSKILIINEDGKIQDSFKKTLFPEGYSIIGAFNGTDGLSQFKAQKDIECVICDIRLPDMTGTLVTKSIKELDPDMGIIILTSHEDVEEAIRAMREGALNYLYKPVHSEKLKLSIKNTIKKLHLERENRKLTEDLVKKNRYFQLINDAAQQVLLNMLPKSCPRFERLKASAVYRCCDNVGGDMYDIFQLGNKIIFYVFDVCGHGILSAVMTMMMKSSFQNIKFLYEHAGIIPDINKVINSLNREMVMNTSSHIYVTLFAGVLNLVTNELTYVSAGHIDQYLHTKEGIVPLSSTSTVIGVFDDIDFETKKVTLEPGDRLFLFTDGIAEIWKAEVINATRKMQNIIVNSKSKSIDDTVKTIYDDILALYGNDKPDDDITLLGIELIP